MLVVQADAEIVMGQGVIASDSDGLAVFGDRLIQLTLVLQGNAEVVMGHRRNRV